MLTYYVNKLSGGIVIWFHVQLYWLPEYLYVQFNGVQIQELV